MYSSFRLAAKYVRYFVTASNGKGHGIHSPFVFDFVTHVLNDKRHFYAYDAIEKIRYKLLLDNRLLQVEDYGAGSVTGKKQHRRVNDIARSAAKPKKLGRLLFRITSYYQPATVVELGTSLGLSAAYLAMSNPSARVISFEGAGALATVAKENFSLLNLYNIETIVGNFDETLEPVLEKLVKVDLAFVDGNHRKEPTLRYFTQLLRHSNLPAVLIFDDIHWSAEMELAWEEIKRHPDVMLTIDLFFIGLVFISDDFKVKQHFIIRF